MSTHLRRTHSVPDHARRNFLQLTLTVPWGVAALASSSAWLSGCSREPATQDGYRVLRANDIPMLEKLLPAVMGDGMPTQSSQRLVASRLAVQSFDQLLYDTSPTVRGALLPLLDLLTTGVTRGPLFGVWKSWENTTEASALEMLDDWSRSHSEFMRAAYNAFVAFASMSWYFDSEHQADTGYPGPPGKVSTARV